MVVKLATKAGAMSPPGRTLVVQLKGTSLEVEVGGSQDDLAAAYEVAVRSGDTHLLAVMNSQQPDRAEWIGLCGSLGPRPSAMDRSTRRSSCFSITVHQAGVRQ